MNCDHNAALLKLYEADALIVEAYGLWKTAEIRRCHERLGEALDELRDARGFVRRT